MARFQPGISGNPYGRPKGVTPPSTFFRRELFQPNKDRVKKIFEIALKMAEEGHFPAIKLIFECCIPKQMGLDEDEVQSIVEEKLRDISKEQLEKIQREIFEAMKEGKGEESPKENSVDSNGSSESS